ncbi:MAG: PIN domain-containing protein [Thiobacillaceae bacterium]|nr:PIN domain-containing protein [Thiobacillaceae bacterium]MCX7673051.1 PIN domain-containing protein [Thiobacillaceae bacterium]MDW8324807.1 PIN domain-containing protein [Burkholderiales bacterium]
MRVFFDTNVLVYLFDRDAPDKQKRARALIESEVEAGRAILSTQVLQEFYVAVTHKLLRPLEPAAALSALQKLAMLPHAQVDADLVLQAAKRSQTESLSFWDALIVETALHCGARWLYSEDLQHGRSYDGLQVINPFQA